MSFGSPIYNLSSPLKKMGPSMILLFSCESASGAYPPKKLTLMNSAKILKKFIQRFPHSLFDFCADVEERLSHSTSRSKVGSSLCGVFENSDRSSCCLFEFVNSFKFRKENPN